MSLSRNHIGVILIISLFIALLVYNISSSSNLSYTTSINDSSVKTYSDYGISFNYPSNWKIGENEESGNIVIFVYDHKSSHSPMAIIQILPNPQGLTDEGAWDSIINSENPEGTKEISNRTITFDGEKAYEQIFVGDSLKQKYITLAKNGNTYELVFQAPEKNYTNEKSNLDIILNSFKID